MDITLENGHEYLLYVLLPYVFLWLVYIFPNCIISFFWVI